MFERPGEQGPITTRLGSYELIRPLARGGMAQLYLARAIGPEGFEKIVVLKRILPHHAEDPQHVRSFLDEAKLVGGFDHPHIAHVYDLGTIDGTYFFTMEHVHGPNVHTILKRCKRIGHALPIEHAVLIARDIASALHYAHERRGAGGMHLQVVHRDVSPSNIIVSYDGVPKLIDFGIAKAASSSLKTQTGALKGKISYMSPEQARGATLDRRSDVFSLGVVLWEMIACRQLHKGLNNLRLLEEIIYEAPPRLTPERDGCPPELSQIVARALALDPADRYPTAQELQLALEELARQHRLAQSRVLLARTLHALFADEIRVWNDALQGNPTVTNAAAVPPGDQTSPTLPLDTRQIVVSDDDELDFEEEDRVDPVAPPPVPPDAVATPPTGRRSLAPTPVTTELQRSEEMPTLARPLTDRADTIVSFRPVTAPKLMRLAIAAGIAIVFAFVGVAIWSRSRSAPERPASSSAAEAPPGAESERAAAPTAEPPETAAAEPPATPAAAAAEPPAVKPAKPPPAPEAAAPRVEAKPPPAPAEPPRKIARRIDPPRKIEPARKPPAPKSRPAPKPEPATAKPAPKPEPKYDPDALFPP